MIETLFVFIALAGAAVLGFLFSTSLSRRILRKLEIDNTAIQTALKEKESAIDQLKLECESRMIAVENLQRISQDVENQAFEHEKALKFIKNENDRLVEELQHMTENPIEKIKEIDVIREVPILIFREVSMPESRKEKATKLMKAFKKGYLDEHGELQITQEQPDETSY